MFVSAEPDWRPSASLMSTAAGGVFVMKVNERSSKTVISSGLRRPFSCACWALTPFVHSTMLTPCWPSAGPTGGAGFACPPGICSLMSVRTFLAIFPIYAHASLKPGTGLVQFLDLVEGQLDGDLALEDVDEHLQLLLV